MKYLMLGLALMGLLTNGDPAFAQQKNCGVRKTIEPVKVAPAEIERWTVAAAAHIAERVRPPLYQAMLNLGSAGPNGNRTIVIANMRQSGQIVSTCVKTSSGFPVLDKVAAQLVMKAGPVPPMPPQIPTGVYPVEVPIVFVGIVVQQDPTYP